VLSDRSIARAKLHVANLSFTEVLEHAIASITICIPLLLLPAEARVDIRPSVVGQSQIPNSSMFYPLMVS
jgi:hypothetical protein